MCLSSVCCLLDWGCWGWLPGGGVVGDGCWAWGAGGGWGGGGAPGSGDWDPVGWLGLVVDWLLLWRFLSAFFRLSDSFFLRFFAFDRRITVCDRSSPSLLDPIVSSPPPLSMVSCSSSSGVSLFHWLMAGGPFLTAGCSLLGPGVWLLVFDGWVLTAGCWRVGASR